MICFLGPMATVTTPLVHRMVPSLTVPSITVPACSPIMSPTITSPLLHPHPTSPGVTTTVYRGFAPLRDHRSVPYPTPYLRYNSEPQNEVPGYQSPPGTISSQWWNVYLSLEDDIRIIHRKTSFNELMPLVEGTSSDCVKRVQESACIMDCFIFGTRQIQLSRILRHKSRTILLP